LPKRLLRMGSKRPDRSGSHSRQVEKARRRKVVESRPCRRPKAICCRRYQLRGCETMHRQQPITIHTDLV
ncbi:hypothetical protein H4217_005837, partial [Coemansia sp. RSA 1939]